MAERVGSVILASSSPRRRDLLGQLGLVFVVSPSDIDESELPGEDPVAYVRRLAADKAEAASSGPDDVVIAADTTVDVDGTILAKPEDEADARRMLQMLSGRAHRVHTGVAVRYRGSVIADVATTMVKIAPITSHTLDWYIATGEPFGKAGAYAIQGEGAGLVEGVQGSTSNVIGLPLALLDALFTQHGLSLPEMVENSKQTAD